VLRRPWAGGNFASEIRVFRFLLWPARAIFAESGGVSGACPGPCPAGPSWGL